MGNPKRPYNVCFVHPDLGIGGAERLAVDAALALKQRGCNVHFVTAHHDKSHCFKETADGTLLVTVYGDWIPRQIFGCFFIIFAFLRALWVAVRIYFDQKNLPKDKKYDVYFVDQVSVGIPILKKTGGKILFYCHHPDMCLSTHDNIVKRIYRFPFDRIEQYTTGLADVIFANSIYTLNIFFQTFNKISAKRHDDKDLVNLVEPSRSLKPNQHLTSCNKVAHIPIVLYPSINTKEYDSNLAVTSSTWPIPDLPSGKNYLISLNRFERKKNINLAVKAFSVLKQSIPLSTYKNVHLIIAGGYDSRLSENVDHLKELRSLAKKLGVNKQITFLPNFTNEQRNWLLMNAACLLYTPENEHFGIVPLEGMYCCVPVIASNSGGPKETILNEKTGFLANNDPESFAQCIARILSMREESRRKMGQAGRMNVIKRFSFQAFEENLYNTLVDCKENNLHTDVNRVKEKLD